MLDPTAKEGGVALDPFVSGDLRIDCVERDAVLVVEWRGRSNDRAPARILSPYIRAIYDAAMERKLAVEMHFEHLEHFNSSTITALIQFVQEARAKRVRLAVVYDSGLKWQKLNFEALRVFASDDLLSMRSI